MLDRSAAKLTGAASVGERDPHRSLAALWRIVDAADEVPGERDAVGALADAGAPVPLGAAGVMADRVVDHGERIDRSLGAAVDAQRAVRGHSGLLARPYLRLPARAERFDARLLLQLEVEQDAAAVYPQAPGRGGQCLRAGSPVIQLDFAAPGQQARALAHQLLLAHVQRPESLPGRADLHQRRTGHQLLAENRHIAPAL